MLYQTFFLFFDVESAAARLYYELLAHSVYIYIYIYIYTYIRSAYIGLKLFFLLKARYVYSSTAAGSMLKAGEERKWRKKERKIETTEGSSYLGSRDNGTGQT